MPEREIAAYYSLRRRERHMTLVAMGLSYDEIKGEHVIAVCDKMLSADVTSFSADILKVQRADKHGRWMVGYSGDPDRFELFRAHLRYYLGLAAKDKEPDVAAMRLSLERAYATLRNGAIKAEILVPAQFKDLDEFQTRGPQMGSLYDELTQKIATFDPELDIIAAGFGSKHPGLFSVENPGRVRSHFVGSCGAHAIGSGVWQAQLHLDACYQKRGNLEEAIYRLLEAKMLADETVVSVGRPTVLLTLNTTGNIERLTESSVETIRAIWEERRRAVPDIKDALEFVED